MKSRLTLISLAATLAACGTPPGVNSDLKYGAFPSAKAPPMQVGQAVAVVDTGPALTSPTQNVSGTSCKNLMWQPAPTDAAAIDMMKRQAAERGFNAVHSVKVGPDPRALILNCWAAITASGVAFSQSGTEPAAVPTAIVQPAKPASGRS